MFERVGTVKTWTARLWVENSYDLEEAVGSARVCLTISR